MNKVVFFILILIFIGCSPIEPDGWMDTGDLLHIDFTSQVVPRDEQIEDFTVMPGKNNVTIEGYFWTPQAGYTLNAEARYKRNIIRLEIFADFTHFGITIPIQYIYHANITEIPSGTYTVKIVNKLHDTTEIVFERDIIVH